MTVPGRAPNWKHWTEAPVLADKFQPGEGERFQSLLDNIAESGHEDACTAWDALATFAIASKNPGALTMTMLALAADGVSYHTLARKLLMAQTTGAALARVLRGPVEVVAPPPPVMVHHATAAPSNDRDWRALVSAAPDPAPRPYTLLQREWRTSDQRPRPRY